jgi:INO80 complex subunit C
MPPKGSRRKPAAATATSTPAATAPATEANTPHLLSGTATPALTPTPQVPTSFAETLSYLHEPRPFKNPNYTKNHNRRAKTLKQVLNAERERVRVEREKLRMVLEAEAEAAASAATGEGNGEDGEKMEVDETPRNIPTMSAEERGMVEEDASYTSTEAAPSTRPHPHYCDITGLTGPYTDPKTMLRYHDKDVYEIIRGLVRLTLLPSILHKA